MKPFVNGGNVSTLGEKRLIARICEKFGPCVPPSPYGAGDDCAVIDTATLKRKLCVTSDAVILGRHFSAETPPHEAAKKLVNRNVSDIASMGARPLSAVTSAVFSKNLSLGWLDSFCEGLAAAAARHGIKLIGGDIASVEGDYFSMHLTLIGQTDGRCLLRSDAREGDFIYVTGPLGLSFESGRHLNFEPRLDEGEWLAARGEVGACTDLSDGLGSDIRNIIPKGLLAEIDAESLPKTQFGGRAATVENALFDGEDYELLFTVRAEGISDFEEEYKKRFGKIPFRVGRIKKALSSEEENALVIVENGRRILCGGAGFDHML